MELREICRSLTHDELDAFQLEALHYPLETPHVPRFCRRCVLESVLPAYERVVEALRELAPNALEITEGELGTAVRRVAKNTGNPNGLWERTNQAAKAAQQALAPFTPVAQRSEDAEG
jgi:hypothetical protein